jgi:polysaccharide pyruvyl transferase WcaK-like protein
MNGQLKIGILNPCGTGNLGDEATVAAVIEEMKRQHPNAEIYAITTNPDDTRRRHGIPAFPVRKIGRTSYRISQTSVEMTGDAKSDGPQGLKQRMKSALKKVPLVYSSLKAIHNCWRFCLNSVEELNFLKQSLRNLKGTHFLIVAGSGQLCDHFGGVSAYPFTLFKWSILTKVVRAKLAFVSVGAGPIHSATSGILIRQSLVLADYRSFRDNDSRQLIEGLGVRGNNHVFPDLAFALTPSTGQYPSSESRTVTIIPFPYYDHRYWPISDRAKYHNYVEKTAAFASWLINNEYEVSFCPSQLRADPLVIEDIKEVLTRNGHGNLHKYLIERPTPAFDDLMAQLFKTRIVVASRFHGALFSFLMSKPVLAISNQQKLRHLMADIGQSEYSLNIDNFDVQSLIEQFKALDANRDAITHQIQEKVSDYRRSLKLQYSRLCELLPSQPEFPLQRSSRPRRELI